MPYKKSVTTKENTPAKQTVESTIETNQIVQIADPEKEQLQKQLDEMKAQMELLMAALGRNNQPVTTEKKSKYITFINLTNGSLILRGSSTYELKGQFAERKFIEDEAKMIVNNMGNAIKNGLVYIADAEFVKDCGLSGLYETILNDKQFKELLTHDAKYVGEIYKSASKAQKKIIVDMITEKRLNAESIDANILFEITQLSGKNLMEIEPLKEV